MPVCYPCKEQNCGAIVDHRGDYCSRHQNGYARDERKRVESKRLWLESISKNSTRATWQKFYNTSAWRKLKKEQLEREPLCACCGDIGTVADHIIPHEGNEVLFFNPNNLQTLCSSCHSRKTASDVRKRQVRAGR